MAQLTWDEWVARGDPCIKGPIPARYMGYKRYRCAVCKRQTTNVILVPLYPQNTHPSHRRGNACLRCYYHPSAHLRWNYPVDLPSWDALRKEAA